MNRNELEVRVSHRLHDNALHSAAASAPRVMNALFEEIMDITSQGDVVRIYGFGRFIPRVRAGGRKSNPKTHATMEFADKVSVVFLPGKPYKKRLNQGEAVV